MWSDWGRMEKWLVFFWVLQVLEEFQIWIYSPESDSSLIWKTCRLREPEKARGSTTAVSPSLVFLFWMFPGIAPPQAWRGLEEGTQGQPAGGDSTEVLHMFQTTNTQLPSVAAFLLHKLKLWKSTCFMETWWFRQNSILNKKTNKQKTNNNSPISTCTANILTDWQNSKKGYWSTK